MFTFTNLVILVLGELPDKNELKIFIKKNFFFKLEVESRVISGSRMLKLTKSRNKEFNIFWHILT